MLYIQNWWTIPLSLKSYGLFTYDTSDNWLIPVHQRTLIFRRRLPSQHAGCSAQNSLRPPVAQNQTSIIVMVSHQEKTVFPKNSVSTENESRHQKYDMRKNAHNTENSVCLEFAGLQSQGFS